MNQSHDWERPQNTCQICRFKIHHKYITYNTRGREVVPESFFFLLLFRASSKMTCFIINRLHIWIMDKCLETQVQIYSLAQKVKLSVPDAFSPGETVNLVLVTGGPWVERAQGTAFISLYYYLSISKWVHIGLIYLANFLEVFHIAANYYNPITYFCHKSYFYLNFNLIYRN